MRLDLEKLTVEAAKKKIEYELDKGGQYSHNIIGIVLGQVADVFSKSAANRLIEECGLDKKGWAKLP